MPIELAVDDDQLNAIVEARMRLEISTNYWNKPISKEDMDHIVHVAMLPDSSLSKAEQIEWHKKYDYAVDICEIIMKLQREGLQCNYYEEPALLGKCVQIIQRDYQARPIGPDTWQTIWHEACNPDEESEHDQFAVITALCELGIDISADNAD